MTEDLTHLCICPVCGAPDCGAEYTLWAEFEGQKEYVTFGGGSFGNYLDYWYYEGIPFCEYRKLPEFVRHHTECIGWRDHDSPEIDANDFLRTLESIKNSKKSDQDFEEYYYPVFKRFVENAIKNDSQLFIEI
ncbi:hypothetical protein DRF65_16990 [Chryseobacterium pennae]|uniref:Uncharacterized protein n=1 Tax=Chryseobacterium pennae TaxID=2258962 RepID=A0A3D9C607_9FLAO|nr:hypothetical protein [Chryseobacterium pennae]REC61189.1 hypothetical protein DRF65_16990 [Chryseobacterium pennae]